MSERYVWLGLAASLCLGCGKGESPTSSGADGASDASTSDINEIDPNCVPISGDPGLLRLRGTVWTGDHTIASGEVFVSAKTGKILCVGDDCSGAPDADKATIICTNGVITPGLINPHDHGTYNHLPRWKHTKLFKDRYEWQKDSSYHSFKQGQATASISAKCEVIKWTELRELVAGTTSIQGVTSSVPACASSAVRDLDDRKGASGFGGGYAIDTQVTKLAGVTVKDAQSWANGLKSGASSALILHLAEGINASSRAEWQDLVDFNLALPGVSLIHAAGLTGVELAEAHAAGIQLIWSPQSNLDLYGDTTRVPTALNLGINVALGPDWTPSGSMNQLDEMKCAKRLSDKRWGGALTDEKLVRMVTVDAAAAVGASAYIGRLATGMYADLAVFHGDRNNPFATVIAAHPSTVELTVIGGVAVYGDAAIMAQIGAKTCDTIDVCGVAKMVCIRADGLDKGTDGYADIKKKLEDTLAGAKIKDKASAEFAYGYELWPLFKCDAEAEALIHCDVIGGPAQAPSDGDLDGDSKVNASDNCPKVWNPDQSDLDGDGAGDACDGCPIVAGSAPCPKPGADDPDGDGLANAADNCPNYANPNQKDTDGDGHGDDCDPCILQANPGEASCPSLAADVTAINQDAVTYVDGVLVSVPQLYVTAVKPAKSGAVAKVWAQAVPGGPWQGILLEMPATPKVKPGEAISVIGKVFTDHGQRTISEAQLKPLPLSLDVTATIVAIEDLADNAKAPQYRALLVMIQNVKVEDTNADSSNGGDFGEVLLVGGLRVDDELIKWGTDVTRPIKDDVFAFLRGVMTYTFGEEKLLPRGALDFGK